MYAVVLFNLKQKGSSLQLLSKVGLVGIIYFKKREFSLGIGHQ